MVKRKQKKVRKENLEEPGEEPENTLGRRVKSMVLQEGGGGDESEAWGRVGGEGKEAM